ncbi:MAG: hypothetical protein PHX38_02135 [Sulfuricella sp.]|nr:hypothetical protein [Sulfuricella sp.]
MDCFHIDESGYTGFDLLNAEQRFQGATAVAISDEEVARLIQAYFPNPQAPELKYHALARRPGYRQPLLDLQRAVLSQRRCVTYVCDKRFFADPHVPGLRRRTVLLRARHFAENPVLHCSQPADTV